MQTMKEYQAQSELYKVLMHPTRLAILDVLREGEQCVCHLETVLELRQAHISQHLMVLREAGLVADRRDGWNIFYRVCQPEIYTILDAMDTFSHSNRSVEVSRSPASKQLCPCPKCNSDSSQAITNEQSKEIIR